MKINVNCIIENVETYTGKNGFGANVTISQLVNKRRELLEFSTTSAENAKLLEEHLQEEMELELELTQNKFGIRIGEIISCNIT